MEIIESLFGFILGIPLFIATMYWTMKGTFWLILHVIVPLTIFLITGDCKV